MVGWVGFFCNRVSSGLRNKTGLFWETENWFGPYVGLKACKIKELRTDWFLKLDRRALGCSKRPTASVRGRILQLWCMVRPSVWQPSSDPSSQEEGLGGEKEPLQDCKALW